MVTPPDFRYDDLDNEKLLSIYAQRAANLSRLCSSVESPPPAMLKLNEALLEQAERLCLARGLTQDQLKQAQHDFLMKLSINRALTRTYEVTLRFHVVVPYEGECTEEQLKERLAYSSVRTAMSLMEVTPAHRMATVVDYKALD